MDNGYIDITDDKLRNLNILIGGRGIGKTFSVLKHRGENAIADPVHHKFIWMRDTVEVVKKIAAGNSLFAPIKSAFPDFPDVTIRKIEGNYCFCIENPDVEAEDGWVVIGYLMALSTFHNTRGISYEDVDCIVWDEFIPEEGTVIKKNQGIIFLNAYESINRNREFDGKPPCRIIFLSNAEDIYSDVLEDLGVSGIIEDLQYSGKKKYVNKDIWIEFLSSKKFYEKKSTTFIYRIAKNKKFTDMALENKFTNNLALIKKKVDLKGSVGILTLSDRYTLVKLANGCYYYKLGVWKNCINYDMDNEQEAMLYRLLFTDKLRLHYIAGEMFFDSIYTQRKILQWSKI